MELLPEDDKDIRLGSLALQKKVVTLLQVKEALSIQGREATDLKLPRQLGLILVSIGAITPEQLAQLLSEQATLRSRRLA